MADDRTPPLAPKGKVFISYAWEDKDFVARVRKLADDLRQWGADAWIDQYEGENGPAEGWPAWMDKTIREASAVLMVCSPKYLRRVRREERPGVGLGATWEAHLIHQHLYEAGATGQKFRAVLLDPAHSDSIPTPVAAFTHFKLYEPKGFESLYRALTGQHRVVAPPLGTPRKMPRDGSEAGTSGAPSSGTSNPQASRADGAKVNSGSVKLAVSKRLVNDWMRLADYFDIPIADRSGFQQGRGPEGVWEWLEARNRLAELEAGLREIGRGDLITELKGK